MKNPEYIPRNEEQKEEDERLYKNDPGVYEGRNPKYVPIEDVADEATVGEKEDEESLEGEDEEEKEPLDEEEEINKQKIIDEKRQEIIGFMQRDENVAHVGPEFDVKDKIPDNVAESVKEENIGDREQVFSEVGDTEKYPTFMSKAQSLRKVIAGDMDYRKNKRNTGAEKDNMKTISDSKKERSFRGKIRGIFHNREN